MKRHIALLLAVVMCISFLPANFAAATDAATGKTGRTIYTDEMIENARENIGLFDWAKTQRDSAVSAADTFVAKGADFFWGHVTSQGIPRAYHLGIEGEESSTSLFDPQRYTCRDCGTNLYSTGGNYPWIVNPITNPWKIQCRACGESFPSNDFEKLYKLGVKVSPEGKFDRILALEAHREMLIEEDKLSAAALALDAPGADNSDTWYLYYGYGVEGGYLHNDLHKDKNDPRWGVDDGWGYVTGETLENGLQEIVPYIALYNHFANFQSGTNNLVSVVNTLGNAYMYTGNAEYGILGAIILDRFADNYPDYALNVEEYFKYPNNNGGPNAGKAIGRIWECFVAEGLAEAYDKLYPAFDEPEVVEFLSEKATTYGLTGKDSAESIRANIENGILREIFSAAKKAQIHGNFGLHQKAVLSAAIALDDPTDTPDMIDWVYADEGTVIANGANAACAGGNINSMLVDGLYRDGQNLESPSYNEMGISDLLDGAVALQRYADNGGNIGENESILEHPKYLGLINSFLPITIGRKGVPGLADAGTAASYTQWPGTAYLQTAFQTIKDNNNADVREEVAKIAQQLYERGISEDSHYDIWTANPDSLYEDVMSFINNPAYGEYDWDKSTIMTGYGYAVLRAGTLLDKKNVNGIIDTQRSFMLNFSGHYKHNHGDYLDLLIEAYGIGMTTDLGYPETPVAGDPHSHEWASTAFAHNTVIVDNANFVAANGTPKEPLHFDATDSKVKVMEARVDDAYANTSDYRRTVVMVDYDDEVSYGVDFFKVAGGSDHLYGFTPNSNDRPTSNLTFGAVRDVYDSGSSVAAYNTWMEDAQTAEDVESGFYLDYEIKDFKGYGRNSNLDVNLRVTMLNDADEVSLVSTTPQRIAANAAIGNLERFVVRRNDSNSLFTAVYEPYKRGDRYVANISEVDAGAAKAVKVEFANEDRIDYIVYAEDNTATYTVTDGDFSFDFSGFVGVYSVDSTGSVLYSYINDGTKIGDMTATAAVTGNVTGFQTQLSLDNYIDVTFDSAVEDADALVGRMIIATPSSAAVGNAAYVIEGVDLAADGMSATLDLGNVSTIDKGTSGAYTYIPATGAFSIPMSYEEKNAIEKVELSATTANMFVNDELTLTATVYPAEMADAEIIWTSDKNDVATVEGGVVKAVGEGTAVIKAAAAVGGKSATCVVTVAANKDAFEHEYITTQAAFNTDKMMTTGTNYGTTPVRREANGGIYFLDMLDWTYEVPAEYNNVAAGEEAVAFMAMNLDATEKWAYESHKQTLGGLFLANGNLQMEFTPSNYTTAGRVNHVALRVVVEAAGEYVLSAKAAKATHGVVVAPYFFEAGAEGVDYLNAETYPEGSQLKYFNMSESNDYVGLGKVTVDFPGEYIILFTADENSFKYNTNVLAANGSQAFQLAGVKLTPASEDTITGLTLAAEKKYLEVNEESTLALNAIYEILGDAALDASAVEFESSDAGIVKVSDAGVVTGKAAGSATIKATLKADETITASVTIKVVEKKDPYAQDFVLGLSAFNKANMVEGAAYTTTPTLRPTHKILYYRPVMHWDYEIPAEYAADGVAFKAMDLTKTAPWAYESDAVKVGGPILYDSQLNFEFDTRYYSGDDASRITFRIFADAPGEYLLKVKAAASTTAPVPAVYFFNDGEAVNNAAASTYPADSKLGYFDVPNGGSDYVTIGTVTIDEVGEYIVSFVGDETSLQRNPNYTARDPYQVQTLSLNGMKLVPIEASKLSYNFGIDAFNYDKMASTTGIVAKVTDDYYYRNLVAELGFAAGTHAVMIMNENLANPDLFIPAGYYGEGSPAEGFYAMDTTEDDGDAKGTDPWKFAGGNAMDNAETTILQIRGTRENSGDGFHPYFDRTLYTDGADTQFVAFSVDVPAAGDYVMTVDAGRGTHRAAPAVYFFKDAGTALTDASFITSAQKVGYINSADTTASNDEYLGMVTAPTSGKYIIALVMDTTSASLADAFYANSKGATEAQYIQLYGIDLTPMEKGAMLSFNFAADKTSVAKGKTATLPMTGVFAEAGEKEISDLSIFDFTVAPEGIVTVEDGVVTGLATGTATVTATLKEDPTKTDTIEVSVFEEIVQRRYEFVTSQKGFNTDLMQVLDDYANKPVIRNANKTLNWNTMFTWTYEVPAEYHNAENEADRVAFMAMDTTEDDGDAKLTDKWSIVSTAGGAGGLSGFYLTGSSAQIQFVTSRYTTSSPWVALRLNIDAAGEYFLNLKSIANKAGAAPAVYFFKEDAKAFTVGDASTYPAGSKIGYFEMAKSSDYVTMGKVTVAGPGDYVLAFSADAESLTYNSEVLKQGETPYQWFDLAGVELIPVKDDVKTGLKLVASVPEVFVGGTSELSVKELWKYAGEKNALISEYTFTSSNSEIAKVEGNVITGVTVSENPVTITATHKTTGETATLLFKVAPQASILEYVFALSAFNKANMVEGAAYSTTPVLRPTHKLLYYTPAMHWDYTIPAEYAADGVAFKAMNLSATAPWAYAAHKTFAGSPLMYDSQWTLEFGTTTYTTTAPSFAAFTLKIDAPGEYYLQLKAPRADTAPVPAVYFFKADAATAGAVSSYPASSKLGYFDIPNGANAYVDMGTVNVAESGEYIIAFVGDATSLEMNPTANASNIQQFNLNAIKLTPKSEDKIKSLTLTADATSIGEEATTQLSLSGVKEFSGACDVAASDVTFTADPAGIVKVSADGVVTGLAEGTATITAALKSDPSVTATIEIEVFKVRVQRVYEFVTSKAGFNTDLMQTLDDYANKPVIRNANKTLNLAAMFDWTYEVPAEYHNAENEADRVAFMAMDTTESDGDPKLTDKWARLGAAGGLSGFYMTDTVAQIQFVTTNYGVSNPYVVLRLNIDAAGEYFLNLKSDANKAGAAPAVYFFKEDAKTFTVGDASTYPADSKLGYFEMAKSSEYATFATVDIAAPGDYVLAFSADAESLTYNSEVLMQGETAYQWFDLAGVQLIPTKDDAVESFKLSVNVPEIFVGEKAQLSIKEVYKYTGEKDANLNDYTLEVEGTGISLLASGVITGEAVTETPVIIKATNKKTGTTETITFKVVPKASEKEFVFSLGAFNMDNMVEGDAYTTTPVLRPTHRIFYFTDAMKWDYEIPAEYAADGVAFNAMDLTKTAPWAVEAYRVNMGRPILYNGNFTLEFTRNSYGTATASFAAFKLKIDAPGEYFFQLKANRADAAPVPAVYFFKDGTEGVTNATVSTYPADAKIGYFDIPNGANAYVDMGRVNVTESGEYILAFVGDATSAEMNETVTGTDTQTFNITGAKLIPTADDVAVSATMTASAAEIGVGEKSTLSITEVLKYTGEREANLSDYIITSSDSTIAKVEQGAVIGVSASENPVTITAKHKTEGVTATVAIKVVPDPTTLEFVTSKAGFNTDLMKTTNDAYSSTPVMRLADGGNMHFKTMFDWTYEADGVYNNVDGTTSFFPMDTTESDGDAKLTDKWAFVAGGGYQLSGFYLTAGSALLQMPTSQYGVNGRDYVALRLNVPAPGEYFLSLKSSTTYTSTSAAPAVYFFKEGTTGVSYGTASSYPADSKLGYFDMSENTDYAVVGKVNAAESGNYIVAFAVDAESLTYNDATMQSGEIPYQWFNLGGIKLIPTSEDVVTETIIAASEAEIHVDETATLSVKEVYKYTGEKDADIADYEFTSSNSEIAKVEGNVVTGVAVSENPVTITATNKTTGATATVAIKVVPYATELEYVIGLNGFNKANMTENDAYGTTPTLRPTHKILYYRPTMHWDYEIPAEYAADGVAFKAMDLTKTAPWAFEAFKQHVGSPILYDGNITLEFKTSTYGTATGSFIALRLKIDAPGEYNLQLKSARNSTAPAPAVYFFKDSEATSDTITTYPADAKVGYFDIPNGANAYVDMGTVNVAESGEYIIAFVGDATSLEMNPTATDAGVQTFTLQNIKLTPVSGMPPVVEPTITGIEIEAADTELEIDEIVDLLVKAIWSDGREEYVIEGLEFSAEPTGIVEVSGDGRVTAKSAGTATITASYAGFTATVDVTVAEKKVPATEIVLTAEDTELTVDDVVTYTAVVLPDNTTDDTTVEWTVEGDAVTVDGGVVTAVKAGSATVKVALVANPAIFKTVTVTVAPKTIAATGITLDKTELYLEGGKSTTLVATVVPPEATMDKTVTWSSDNEAVATVDPKTGVITGVVVKDSAGKDVPQTGTVHITATLDADPSITATATVNVSRVRSRSRSLELMDIIYIISYVALENVPVDEIDITVDEENGDFEADAGLLVWTEEEYEALGGQIAFDEEHAVKGLTLSTLNGTPAYYGRSEGIKNADLHKKYWSTVYVRLPDGTYAYSDPKLFGPADYAYTQLNNAQSSADLKKLCIAILNYISAYQTYFGKATADELVNKDLTDAQKSISWSDDVSNFNLAPTVPEEKQVTRDRTVFVGRSDTILFEEKISAVKKYNIPDQYINDKIESATIFWKEGKENGKKISQFTDLSGAPSIENYGDGEVVSEEVKLDNRWNYFAPGVAAKDLSEVSYYILGYVKDGDNISYSGVTSYSFEQYIYTMLVDPTNTNKPTDENLINFIKCLYVYERAARKVLLGY